MVAHYFVSAESSLKHTLHVSGTLRDNKIFTRPYSLFPFCLLFPFFPLNHSQDLFFFCFLFLFFPSKIFTRPYSLFPFCFLFAFFIPKIFTRPYSLFPFCFLFSFFSPNSSTNLFFQSCLIINVGIKPVKYTK